MSEGAIRKFIEMHQQQSEGLVLTGMGHVTDMLFITCLPKTKVGTFIKFECHRHCVKSENVSLKESASVGDGHSRENLAQDPV